MNIEALHVLLQECGQEKKSRYSANSERILESIMGTFVAPNDLTEWITTIAQYKIDEIPEILPGWYICSLERAIETYKIVKDMNTPGSEFQKSLKQMFGGEHNYLERYWNNFMLLTDYSDGGCGIGSMNTDFGGMIIVQEIHAPWQVGFQNIDKLVETALVCRKLSVWKSDGDLDWTLYYQIGKRLNPECEHWQH